LTWVGCLCVSVPLRSVTLSVKPPINPPKKPLLLAKGLGLLSVDVDSYEFSESSEGNPWLACGCFCHFVPCFFGEFLDVLSIWGTF
jgi:hypothetical protein